MHFSHWLSSLRHSQLPPKLVWWLFRNIAPVGERVFEMSMFVLDSRNGPKRFVLNCSFCLGYLYFLSRFAKQNPLCHRCVRLIDRYYQKKLIAKTRENVYICVLINFLQGLPRTKNVHPVFGPKRALWADEHVLISNYEHVLIRSSHKIVPDMIFGLYHRREEPKRSARSFNFGLFDLFGSLNILNKKTLLNTRTIKLIYLRYKFVFSNLIKWFFVQKISICIWLTLHERVCTQHGVNCARRVWLKGELPTGELSRRVMISESYVRTTPKPRPLSPMTTPNFVTLPTFLWTNMRELCLT